MATDQEKIRKFCAFSNNIIKFKSDLFIDNFI